MSLARILGSLVVADFSTLVQQTTPTSVPVPLPTLHQRTSTLLPPSAQAPAQPPPSNNPTKTAPPPLPSLTPLPTGTTTEALLDRLIGSLVLLLGQSLGREEGSEGRGR